MKGWSTQESRHTEL